MPPPIPWSGPPTQREIDAAQRLGISVELYRRFKRNAGPEADRFERGDGPLDIVEEEHLAQKLRIEPGLFKRRHTAPNILVQAARTPGEVARSLLTIICYLMMMFLIIGLGGEAVQRVPGVFQVLALGVLLIPAMLLSSFIWRHLGEGGRDVARVLVKFWPLTLPALLFGIGALKLLLS